MEKIKGMMLAFLNLEKAKAKAQEEMEAGRTYTLARGGKTVVAYITSEGVHIEEAVSVGQEDAIDRLPPKMGRALANKHPSHYEKASNRMVAFCLPSEDAETFMELTEKGDRGWWASVQILACIESGEVPPRPPHATSRMGLALQKEAFFALRELSEQTRRSVSELASGALCWALAKAREGEEA